MPSSVAGMPPTPIGRPPSRQLLRGGANGVMNSAVNYSDSNLLRPKGEFGGSSQSLGTFPPMDTAFVDQYQKWSMALDPASGIQLSESPDMDNVDKVRFSLLFFEFTLSVRLISSVKFRIKWFQNLNNALYPPRSQIKRQKMIYHCKFGEFGVLEGQVIILSCLVLSFCETTTL